MAFGGKVHSNEMLIQNPESFLICRPIFGIIILLRSLIKVTHTMDSQTGERVMFEVISFAGFDAL